MAQSNTLELVEIVATRIGLAQAGLEHQDLSGASQKLRGQRESGRSGTDNAQIPDPSVRRETVAGGTEVVNHRPDPSSFTSPSTRSSL